MYGSESGYYVFINDTDGPYEQYRIGGSTARPPGERVRNFRLPSQPEGCVADPTTAWLYMGEEAVGIWRAGAEQDGDAPTQIISTSERLVADVEGMDIYRDDERVLLIVSSQGSDSFAVYGLSPDYPLLTSFRVRANLALGVDGVSETDGLAVTSASLPGYPEGLLVLQDGRNRMPGAPQNFKLVGARALKKLLEKERQP